MASAPRPWVLAPSVSLYLVKCCYLLQPCGLVYMYVLQPCSVARPCQRRDECAAKLQAYAPAHYAARTLCEYAKLLSYMWRFNADPVQSASRSSSGFQRTCKASNQENAQGLTFVGPLGGPAASMQALDRPARCMETCCRSVEDDTVVGDVQISVAMSRCGNMWNIGQSVQDLRVFPHEHGTHVCI